MSENWSSKPVPLWAFMVSTVLAAALPSTVEALSTYFERRHQLQFDAIFRQREAEARMREADIREREIGIKEKELYISMVRENTIPGDVKNWAYLKIGYNIQNLISKGDKENREPAKLITKSTFLVPGLKRGQQDKYIGMAEWRDRNENGSNFLEVYMNFASKEVGVEFIIRPNFDSTLPASHTIFVRVQDRKANSGLALVDIAAITFKRSENDVGRPLFGLPFPVSENVFLVGLSSLEMDRMNNRRLFTENMWVDVAFRTKDGNISTVSFELPAEGKQKIISLF